MAKKLEVTTKDRVHTVNGVDFHAGGRKWTFVHRASGYQLSRDIPGGKPTAERVAHIIGVSFNRNKRSKVLDSRSRLQLDDLFLAARGGKHGLSAMMAAPDQRFNYVPHL